MNNKCAYSWRYKILYQYEIDKVNKKEYRLFLLDLFSSDSMLSCFFRDLQCYVSI